MAIQRHLQLLLALAIFTLLAGYWTLFEPFGRDQGIHATIGYALIEGLPTYSEVYNVKPPITTAIHAFSQLAFGHYASSIRLLDLIAVCGTAYGIFLLLLRMELNTVPSILAALTFISAYYNLDFWTRAQTDGWAGFLLVFFFLALLNGWMRRRIIWFTLAGFILGLSFATKYTIGTAALAVFAPFIIDDVRFVFRLKDFFFFLFGGILALAICCLTLALMGSIFDFFSIQSYVFVYASSWKAQTDAMIGGIIYALSGSKVVGLLVFISVWFLIRNLILMKFNTANIILGIWIITGMVSYWVQGKGFPYHSLPLLIAMTSSTVLNWQILVNIGARVPHVKFRRELFVSFSGAFILSLLPWSDMLLPAVAQYDETLEMTVAADHVAEDFSSPAIEAAADRLNGMLGPKDNFFLWGYETMLYFHVRQPPLHRYPYSWPFVVNYYDGRYTADLMARLNRDPPELFVLQYRDATPWVTGEIRDSRQMIDEFPALASFLKASYVIVDSIDRFEIWGLKESR
ncbi:ArnT family glycosyltransferase [Ovoidimarina sediminis]|uniref:ArnT family glycosyltransferase n=1 Tax=Ovoidimarina sediminis TaxID=3079856 RepID=UPI00291595A5|nr:glycosyltransferase family 39 protein [Rhodophyticola sp. MJ-SS7]MDU8946022.1 glycosyltransferase family 39 protein [Rhodophyticola sp. MJ-SS7]